MFQMKWVLIEDCHKNNVQSVTIIEIDVTCNRVYFEVFDNDLC